MNQKVEQTPGPESFQGKTVLIAGVAGFIGGHLAEFYLKQGVRVLGLDNFITGSKANVEILLKYPTFNFFETDITKSLPELSHIPVHYVYNLASPASPADFKRIPLEIMRVNSEGVYRILEFAKEKKARVLQASTSEVYGDPEVHPQVESYNGNVNTLGIRSVYDESKRFAEAMVMTYHRKYQVDTRIVRIFNTYGPRMRPNDGRVIPNFVNQALKNGDITIYGDGLQTRSYCYVTDLVNFLHAVLCSDEIMPVNIGNPDEHSVKRTAELITKFLGSSSKVTFQPLPEHDPKRRRPDITKLCGLTQYRPQVGFEEGLKITADYFKTLA